MTGPSWRAGVNFFTGRWAFINSSQFFLNAGRKAVFAIFKMRLTREVNRVFTVSLSRCKYVLLIRSKRLY